ncbi:uncharacterized protein LOC115622899 [Scaptodrosophila lebanonensis]|uniref:Uncharacterized protein LOC115622899 n=1 Tax=Drosophila lebanonensis TaxID=7225 RepID=A0A6J2TA24_DROLE|nr:uncharacterized protein LOC115622899 [Scaptodrosophila lebanonensis]
MNSALKLTALVLVFVQLLGAIHGGVYDNTNLWVASDKTLELPESAVLGGFDPYGYYIYVGRVVYSSSILPARIVPETGTATYNTESLSNSATSYQVLVANETVSYHWVRSFDGYREKNAVSVGTSATNDRVFVCRAKTDGALLVGTLYLAQRVCIIKYQDLPLRKFDKYEVLIRKKELLQWQPFGPSN